VTNLFSKTSYFDLFWWYFKTGKSWQWRRGCGL